MSATWTWLIGLLAPIIEKLLSLLAPALKDELSLIMNGWYAKALATPSPLDDMVVKTICDLLGITLTTPRGPPSS